MRVFERAAIIVAFCALAGCAAPAPPPVVRLAAVAPSAAAAAPPDAGPGASAPEEPAPPIERCAEQRGAVEAARGRAATMADCDHAHEVVDELMRCRQGDETDREARLTETLAFADECSEAVTTSDYAKLVASLPAAEAARHDAARKGLRAAATRFCTRCNPVWALACVGAVYGWVDRRAVAAAKGELTVELPSAKIPGSRGKPLAAAFGELARSICSLPAPAWKAHRAPAGCEQRALLSLVLALPEFPAQTAGFSSPESCTLDAPSP
jgi:hypothetical protein